MQQATSRSTDKRYGVPAGTDGRVLFFNKKLFAQAGLPRRLAADELGRDRSPPAQKLKSSPACTPIQLNAGTAMGEATTMQGVLPLLVGTGAQIYSRRQVAGRHRRSSRDVLGLYQQDLRQRASATRSCSRRPRAGTSRSPTFAAGKIGILLEGDYFWRASSSRRSGIAPMADRDTGRRLRARSRRRRPGSGRPRAGLRRDVRRRRATCSTRTRKYPQQAWELLPFMNSAGGDQGAAAAAAPGSPQRKDVNAEVLAGDPMLTFIADEGAAADRVPAGPGGVPAGVGGAAAGDRRRGRRHSAGRGRGGLPGRRWRRQSAAADNVATG